MEVGTVDVVLEDCNELNDFSFMMKDVKYPCVVIEGITSNDEIEFFRNRGKETDSSLAAYMVVEGEPVSLGFFDLTLENLLAVREIYDYKLVIYKERSSEGTLIDLNDPSTLIKFIRL